MIASRPEKALTEQQVLRAADLIRARDGLRDFISRCKLVRSDVPFELAVLHSGGDIIGTKVFIPREWIEEAASVLIENAFCELAELGVRE